MANLCVAITGSGRKMLVPLTDSIYGTVLALVADEPMTKGAMIRHFDFKICAYEAYMCENIEDNYKEYKKVRANLSEILAELQEVGWITITKRRDL